MQLYSRTPVARSSEVASEAHAEAAFYATVRSFRDFSPRDLPMIAICNCISIWCPTRRGLVAHVWQSVRHSAKSFTPTIQCARSARRVSIEHRAQPQAETSLPHSPQCDECGGEVSSSGSNAHAIETRRRAASGGHLGTVNGAQRQMSSQRARTKAYGTAFVPSMVGTAPMGVARPPVRVTSSESLHLSLIHI